MISPLAQKYVTHVATTHKALSGYFPNLKIFVSFDSHRSLRVAMGGRWKANFCWRPILKHNLVCEIQDFGRLAGSRAKWKMMVLENRRGSRW